MLLKLMSSLLTFQADWTERTFVQPQQFDLQNDVLINNTGFDWHVLFQQRDPAADQAMMQVNMLSLTKLTRLYLPSMVAQHKGKILNVSSTASFLQRKLKYRNEVHCYPQKISNR